LSKNFSAQEAPHVSLAFLRLGGQLLKAGAIAMKCESSGIAHSRSRWLELAESLPPSKNDDAVQDSWPALFQAYVQLPIDSGDDLYACGMHLLGKPDLIASHRILKKAANHKGPVVTVAVDLFLLAECPEGEFGSDKKSPRFRVV